MSDDIQFGCMRCKRTKRNLAAKEAAEKTLESIFDACFDLLRKEARALDVEIPIEFKGKMLKWGAKNNLFAPEESVVADRNMLD